MVGITFDDKLLEEVDTYQYLGRLKMMMVMIVKTHILFIAKCVQLPSYYYPWDYHIIAALHIVPTTSLTFDIPAIFAVSRSNQMCIFDISVQRSGTIGWLVRADSCKINRQSQCEASWARKMEIVWPVVGNYNTPVILIINLFMH